MINAPDRVIQLAKEMRRLQVEKDNHNFSLSILQKRLDEIRLGELPEAMDEAGINSLSIDGVGRVSTRADLYASIPADFKQMAWQWLIANGYENLITQTINASTFKAWAKEQLKAGEELPEELFKITPYVMAVITAA
jgi:hypothetical protein